MLVLLKKVLFVVSLMACTSLYAEQASKDSVKELMRLTGAGNMSVQMMNQMLPALKSMAPDQPEKFWDDFMAEVDPNELENLVIPVYQKYLSENEIKSLIEFYQSPVGRKIISVQPHIMQESMMIGQNWGRGIAQKVLHKLNSQAPSAGSH
ncbi:MAG: hypothetical protein CSA49_04830 [Gammaproteobacteria bacterium]|nr:MAG: hypothetical protein CSA49_04830 [Gammaproteobacteria bacterium]